MLLNLVVLLNSVKGFLGKPFHDIKTVILFNSILSSSSLLQFYIRHGGWRDVSKKYGLIFGRQQYP